MCNLDQGEKNLVGITSGIGAVIGVFSGLFLSAAESNKHDIAAGSSVVGGILVHH